MGSDAPLALSDTVLTPQAQGARRRAAALKIEGDRAAWAALLADDANAGAALLASGWSPFEPGQVAPPLASPGLPALRRAALEKASAWKKPDDLHAMCCSLDALNFWGGLVNAFPALGACPQKFAPSWALALTHAQPATLAALARQFDSPPPAEPKAWVAFLLREDSEAAFGALAESFSPNALWLWDKDLPPGILASVHRAAREFQNAEPAFNAARVAGGCSAKDASGFWPDRFEPLFLRMIQCAGEKPLSDKSQSLAVLAAFSRALGQVFHCAGNSAPEAVAGDACARRVISYCVENHWEAIVRIERSWRAASVASMRQGDAGKALSADAPWLALSQRLRGERSASRASLSLWEMAVRLDEPQWLEWAERAAGPWNWGEPFVVELPNPHELLRARDVARERSGQKNVMEKGFANARAKIEKAPLARNERQKLLSLLDLDSCPAEPANGPQERSFACEQRVPTDIESILWKGLREDRPRLRALLAERAAADAPAAAARLQAAQELDDVAGMVLPRPPAEVSRVFMAFKEQIELMATLAPDSSAQERRAPPSAPVRRL